MWCGPACCWCAMVGMRLVHWGSRLGAWLMVCEEFYEITGLSIGTNKGLGSCMVLGILYNNMYVQLY